MTLTIDKRAEPHIRALARAIGWERRQVVEALEAHASIEQPQPDPKPAQHRTARIATVNHDTAPVPKNPPHRSETYRRWVASLPCIHCGEEGPSQCAHSDIGKGAGMKASDQSCFPLCADSPDALGCHSLIGASGEMGKEGRRTLEQVYSDSVQRMARATGNWPKEWD